MNLHRMLLARQAAGRPVTVGLIGAGKFGTMFLSQVRVTDGMHLAGVADLDVERARCRLASAGWPRARYLASSLDDALKSGRSFVTDNAVTLIAHPAVEVI